MRASLLLVLAMGCSGVIGPSGESSDDPDGPRSPTGSTEEPLCTGDRGHARDGIRRLTRNELEATLSAAFGAGILDAPGVRDAATRYPAESPYDLVVAFQPDPDEQHVRGLLAMSEAIGAEVRGTLCETPDRACAERFLDTTAPRLLRHPLEAERRDAYLAIWDRVATAEDPGAATEQLVVTLLQAPEMAFHLDRPLVDCAEDCGDDTRFRVDDHTVAARLAFGLTGAPPDDALLARAARGELRTADAAREEANRLLDTESARAHFDELMVSWLLLAEVAEPHEAITTSHGVTPGGLADEARRELLEYTRYMVFERGATARELMTEPIGFPRSERLAALYESEVATGDEPVDLPAGHGGLLLRIAPLLAGNLSSSPILRGVYVRRHLLCTDIPSPPFDIVQQRTEELAESDPAVLSTREIVTDLTSEGVCAGCHQKINPVGFTLEGFGPLGERRVDQVVVDTAGNELARHPLDTQVDAVDVGTGSIAVDDAPALNTELAASRDYHDCIAERLYTWLHLRAPAGPDACALEDVQVQVHEDLPLRDAWVGALVNEDLFYRSDR